MTDSARLRERLDPTRRVVLCLSSYGARAPCAVAAAAGGVARADAGWPIDGANARVVAAVRFVAGAGVACPAAYRPCDRGRDRRDRPRRVGAGRGAPGRLRLRPLAELLRGRDQGRGAPGVRR